MEDKTKDESEILSHLIRMLYKRAKIDMNESRITIEHEDPSDYGYREKKSDQISYLNDSGWYKVPNQKYHITLIGFGIFDQSDISSRDWLECYFKSITFEKVPSDSYPIDIVSIK